MKLKKSSISCVLTLMWTGTALLAETPASVQTFPLRNTAGLIAPDVRTEAVNYLGRRCVRVTIDGDDRAGIALLPGTDFQDGVIEADIALKTTVPPGVRYPGFIGIAFRVRPGASHYELFYLRPGNSEAADQAMRNHTVQYTSEPDFGWYRLRREWPWVYESHADLAIKTWTKVRIEVAGRSAKLFLNGSVKPSLVVDGLKGEGLHGAIGLWGFTNEEAYFSNVRIIPIASESIRNGSDIVGSWEMTYSNDVSGMKASMELHREGNSVNGTWSGPLGDSNAISGTWRNGYVELSFAGHWPADSRKGAPGPVNVFFEGWFDGDSGKGRMRVEERSDGVWVATRQK
jgi:hypothetical protein